MIFFERETFHGKSEEDTARFWKKKRIATGRYYGIFCKFITKDIRKD